MIVPLCVRCPRDVWVPLQKAEAEEVEKLLAEVRATPKGEKKDLSKAAAKAYNPAIVETSWCAARAVQCCAVQCIGSCAMVVVALCCG